MFEIRISGYIHAREHVATARSVTYWMMAWFFYWVVCRIVKSKNCRGISRSVDKIEIASGPMISEILNQTEEDFLSTAENLKNILLTYEIGWRYMVSKQKRVRVNYKGVDPQRDWRGYNVSLKDCFVSFLLIHSHSLSHIATGINND